MKTKEIIKMAADKKICQPWHEQMKKDSSLQNLCRMYFDGDDWSIENDFPNLETLRKFKGESNPYGLFTDHKAVFKTVTVAKLKTAFFGNSDVSLSYAGFTVAEVIIRHQSKATITVFDHAVLKITILDNAEVEVVSNPNASVSIYTYGNSKIKHSGNIKIYKK